MNIYQTIADGFIKLLKTAYPDRDVFMEEIAHTKEDDEENSSSKDYFFLEVIPVSAITLGLLQTQYDVLVVMNAYLKGESNKEYLKLANELDSIIRPVFSFEDRAITVPSSSIKLTDGLLHYSVTLSFIEGEDRLEPLPLMEELEHDINPY